VLNEKVYSDELNSLGLTVTAEYQDLLNSKYRTGIKIGAELSIFELLNFRAGYFNVGIDDFGFPDNNHSRWKDFTYGFGFEIPFKNLSDGFVPITIRYDYVDKKQTPFGKMEFAQFGNFSVNTLSINWNFN